MAMLRVSGMFNSVPFILITLLLVLTTEMFRYSNDKDNIGEIYIFIYININIYCNIAKG